MGSDRRIFELKQGHGWFGGYLRETDVISCVDSGMWKWHILLVELADSNKIIERERERESSYQGSYEDGLHDGK